MPVVKIGSNSTGAGSTWCCGMGVVQAIAACMCIGQIGLMGFLMMNHDIFQTSLSNLGDMTRNLIQTEAFHITGVVSSNDYNQRKSDNSPPLSSEPLQLEFTTYPVMIKAMDKDDYVPDESKPIVRSLVGSVMDVTFPDLVYRTPEAVRSQYPGIFQELPAYGFMQDYKNPCWRDESSHMKCLPYAYVLGQPKCGTSDLFERMKAHQKIIMPNRKEIRWFSRGEFITRPMWHEGMKNEDVDHVGEPQLGPGSSLNTFTRAFRALEEALEKAPEDNSQKITIDGGPHTLWWPTQSPDGTFENWDVPPQQLLREMQPQAKFILTLADPVKRMYSDYYFLEDNLKPVRPGGATSKSASQFHDRARSQVATFQTCVKEYVGTLRDEMKQHGFTLRKSVDALATVRDSIPAEYHDVLPLWFRASQMCAHDRHTFGVGGHGRLSIGLYVLYLEKWLEHFPISQFLVLRLEDYESNPHAHMQKVFDFLQLGEPNDWDRVTPDRHFNEHRVHREAILEETETLLREFHKPYNALLAAVLRDPGFLWECPIVNGVPITLRSKQIVESRQDASPNDRAGLVARGRDHAQNAHGIDRHMVEPSNDEPPLPDANMPPQHEFELVGGKFLRRAGVPDESEVQDSNRPRVDITDRLKPRRFSIDKLTPPMPDDQSAIDLASMSKNLDEQNVGKNICTAAFTLNIASLKAWLYDIGAPGNLLSVSDGRRNAFHCLAALYTMGEAHSRSHVFAELKGKETWLSEHFDPPLEAKMSSVLSRDIIDHLSRDILRVAEWLLSADVPINGQDTGGNTPLHIATLGGEASLVQFLIDAGADMNIQNNEKRTPLHYAASYGHAEICGMFLRAGAKGDIHDINGVTAMDIISNPGPILRDDAKKYLNIDQRPARQIERRLHPELHPTEPNVGWKSGTGGWSAERLKGFEDDMECEVVDQYFAHEITGEEIFKNYLAHNAPVLIRGLLDNWKVNDLYQLESLLEDHGELNVQVSDIPYTQKFGGGQQVTMSLREYIEEVKAHQIVGGSHPWYVFKGHPIPSASDRADSLVKYDTCPMPDILITAFSQAAPPTANNNNRQIPNDNARRNMFVNAQWALGGAGTGAPIHFHNTAWAALVYGAKKWLIYPPHDMIMSNRQILDFYETERESFAARGVHPVTCVQTAGDVMIIPESWGHGVLNLQETIAIATEYKHSVWRLKPPIHTIASGAPGFDNRSDRKATDPTKRSGNEASSGRLAMAANKKLMMGR